MAGGTAWQARGVVWTCSRGLPRAYSTPSKSSGISRGGTLLLRETTELLALLLVGAGIEGIESDGLGIWGVYAKSIRLDNRDDQVADL